MSRKDFSTLALDILGKIAFLLLGGGGVLCIL